MNESATTDPARQFDFWLGRWELSWPAEQTGGEAGATAHGSNLIEACWDGAVIEENFTTADGGFQGRSWSVYQPATGLWRQTWVDNQGSYLLFSGGFEGERLELRSDPLERDGKRVLMRMVFSDIEEGALRWRWQRSEDGGARWRDLWTIDYRRAG